MTEAPTFVTAERILAKAIKAYQTHPQSPEYLSEFMQAFWNFHGIDRTSLSTSDVVVPQAPYTEAQIRQFMRLDDPNGGFAPVDLGFFLPEILSSPDGLILMGVGFPKTSSWTLRPNHGIINSSNPAGWMRVEASMDTPFRRTNKNDLKEQIRGLGRVGQTLNIYVPSGEAIKEMFDYYPDQDLTCSRLLLSLKAGRVLGARFLSGGGLCVSSNLLSGDQGDYLGGRSFL